MKTIGLVTVLAETGAFLKAQLDKLFSDNVKVNLYILSEMSEKITLTEEAFLVFPGADAFDAAPKHLKYSCETIIANRSVNYDLLDEVFKIPTGTEVYLQNDFKDSTYQSIRYLQELGINHIKYIPVYKGAKTDGVSRPLITFGEYENMPANHEKIIDLGVRIIDVSTIVDILLKLDMPQDTIAAFTTKYVRDIISLTNEMKSLSSHNEYMKNKLETIIQTVGEGILTLDKNSRVSVVNHAAEQILGCRSEDFIGKDLAQLQEKLAIKLNSGNGNGGTVGETGEIVEYFGKKLVINQSKIIHNQSNIETIFAIREVTEIQNLERKLRMKIASKRHVAKYTFDDILGSSELIQKQKKMAKRIAKFDSPVYIYGESGTGKELFAQAIHLASHRKNGPFVAVNFVAMSENLLESELFGYAEGAFTGAKKGGMPGVFEQAHGGTLFLDEIGDSPLSFQIKLLRVLQEKQVRRIGDDKLIPVDVRVIVATNKKVSDLVEEGKFRQDLYYRINVLSLWLPPLRERKEDILCLAREFYKEMIDVGESMDNSYTDFDTFFREIKPMLSDYDFPGNARQLRNIIEYLVCTCESGVASSELLPMEFFEKKSYSQEKDAKITSEREPIELICLKTIYNRSRNGLASGRRSLAAELQCSEEKTKKIVVELEKNGHIILNKGRKGIELTKKGIKMVENQK